ncbi:cytochrome b5, partial [Trichocladium antarcticum]
MKRLLRQLGPYKCGFLRQARATAPQQQRVFTMRELGRHVFPEIGLYCAVDGVVYDLTRYYHSHPGGTELLRQHAGRDATGAFQDAH